MAYTQQVDVTQRVKVTVDEKTFTPEFMAEFNATMFELDTIDDHIRHLAQLYAKGDIDEHFFIEGYGPAKDMGIKFEEMGQEEEIVA